jgi:hypothetical protein
MQKALILSCYRRNRAGPSPINNCFISDASRFLDAVAVTKPSDVGEFGRHQVECFFCFPRSWHEGCIRERQRNVVLSKQIGESLVEPRLVPKRIWQSTNPLSDSKTTGDDAGIRPAH